MKLKLIKYGKEVKSKFATKVSRMLGKSNGKKLNRFCNNCKLKEKNGVLIIEM